MSTRAAVALAGVLALTGCAGPPAEPAPEPLPVTGELRQFRGDAAKRVLQVTLRGRAPVSVLGARIDAGGFSAGPDNAAALTLPAGAVIDLPIQYGRADCEADPGSAQATLTVSIEGAESELVVPLEDRGLVQRLHEAECAERALVAQVRFTVQTGSATRDADGRPTLPVTLRLTRRAPGERVVVQELGAHIVFTVRPEQPAQPLIVLDPEQDEAELALQVIPTRCDGHALAENKRAGLLGAYVGVGDAPPRLTTVVPDDAIQARLKAFAVEGCRG